MVEKRLGVAIAGPDAGTILARISKAESLGVSAVWLTTGGVGLDGLTILGAAAAQTDSILLGTSIIPTYPRHPVAVAQQVQVIAQLAPGRFRLGVGPSHRPTIDGMFGMDFGAPLTNLREYLQVIKPLTCRTGLWSSRDSSTGPTPHWRRRWTCPSWRRPSGPPPSSCAGPRPTGP